MYEINVYNEKSERVVQFNSTSNYSEYYFNYEYPALGTYTKTIVRGLNTIHVYASGSVVITG